MCHKDPEHCPQRCSFSVLQLFVLVSFSTSAFVFRVFLWDIIITLIEYIRLLIQAFNESNLQSSPQCLTWVQIHVTARLISVSNEVLICPDHIRYRRRDRLKTRIHSLFTLALFQDFITCDSSETPSGPGGKDWSAAFRRLFKFDLSKHQNFFWDQIDGCAAC